MDEGTAPVKPIALIFDWGDTLMHVFPDAAGPMADWPQVAAVDGAAAALAQLTGHHRMFVATNADESSASQVGYALARVGLDRHFERIFTMHELCSRKPDPTFFAALSDQIRVPLEDCVMVGDDLQVDILGALRAGWRAIWLNPTNRPFPGHLPLHDGDINSMAELPAAIASPALPRYQTCLNWLLAAGSSHNLLAHVHSVAALAYQMALWIRANGYAADPMLAHRGGLLHDLAKVATIHSEVHKQDHGDLAAEMLANYNQPILAEIARRHLLFRPLDSTARPKTIEQKLVFFMDKLVEQNRVVPLEERIQHLRARYQLDPSRLEAVMPRLYAIQTELCDLAGISPNDLVPRLQAAIY
jgi:putative hydrolase of the HAD superfamily